MEVNESLAPLNRTLQQWPTLFTKADAKGIWDAIGHHEMHSWQLSIKPGDYVATINHPEGEDSAVWVYKVLSRNWDSIAELGPTLPKNIGCGIIVEVEGLGTIGGEVERNFLYVWECHLKLEPEQVATLEKAGFPPHPNDFFSALMKYPTTSNADRCIADAMLTLQRERVVIDMITMVEQLTRDGRLHDAGGTTNLLTLFGDNVHIESPFKTKKKAR